MAYSKDLTDSQKDLLVVDVADELEARQRDHRTPPMGRALRSGDSSEMYEIAEREALSR